MSEYKKNNSFEKRKDDAIRILKKYDDKIPVIINVAKNSKSELKIDKIKYLVPNDLTVGQFIYIIRKRIKIEPEKAIFMFFNNTLAPTSSLISYVYNQYKDDDGFLYSEISLESTFG